MGFLVEPRASPTLAAQHLLVATVRFHLTAHRAVVGPAHAHQLVVGSPLDDAPVFHRSEEHTSELQSQSNLVCRLLLEKKKHSDHCRSELNLVLGIVPAEQSGSITDIGSFAAECAAL